MQEASVSASAVNQAKGDHIPWGWAAITAVGLEVAVTLSAFVWVGIYSYLIHPGEELPYYQNHAQFASPIVSVVVGIPVWFFACRWVGRKAGTRAVAMCLSAWLIVPLIDMPLGILGQAKAYDWTMVAISESTKLVAAYLGARAALKYVLGMRRVSSE
jgi:hypothetical protein